MINRIVKLTFQTENVGIFLDLFESTKAQIRQFEGCSHLELWRVHPAGPVFFTFSIWESEAALETYRQSELFQTTWSRTKVLFAEKPEAWSVVVQSQATPAE